MRYPTRALTSKFKTLRIPQAMLRALIWCIAASSRLILATIMASCSAHLPSVPSITMPKALSMVGKPNLTSFLGVRFGDSLYLVQTRFPSGMMETGVYGADTYRIDNIEVQSIRYEQVKYEFTTYSGMQLVMARFTADSSAKVLGKLVQAIGPPTRQSNLKGSSPIDTEASWELPHGERVIFSGPRRFVAVLGPGGSVLKHDLPDTDTP